MSNPAQKAAGYQRFSQTDARTTRDGFAYQVVGKAKARGYKLELVNFGCGGATTVSIIETKGCKDEARALKGPAYTATQSDAAAKFIKMDINNNGELSAEEFDAGG